MNREPSTLDSSGNSNAGGNKNSSELMRNNLENRSAKLDLNSKELSNKIPNTARQVVITNISASAPPLSLMNPFKIANEIDSLCGAVSRVNHRRNGSILITTNTFEQTQELFETSTFCGVEVKAEISWGSALSQGKIYAPELLSILIDELLISLTSKGVVGIRKLLQDPAKVNSPLFVVSFLCPKLPDNIKIGYAIYKLDPYYPNPLRCTNCWKWGHTKSTCHGKMTCSSCSIARHVSADCTTGILCCPSCKGHHSALSKECPNYQVEHKIFELKTNKNISYQEARSIVTTPNNRSDNNSLRNDVHLQQTMPNHKSFSDFPSLSQLTNNPTNNNNPSSWDTQGNCSPAVNTQRDS